MSHDSSIAAVRSALRLACASIPHLAGLAAAVRLYIDSRVPTAGITGTGRLLVNPTWFSALGPKQQAFIMAHELFHLCLRTHDRAPGTNPRTFNYAHDYIINDMLRVEMQIDVPADGLDYEGAREKSAEEIVRMMRDGRLRGPVKQPPTDMQIALRKAGLSVPNESENNSDLDDVISQERERELFPNAEPRDEEQVRKRILTAAAKTLSLGVLKERLDKLESERAQIAAEVGLESMPDVLKSYYRPPWEMALQAWMEAIAPGPRSYARPSRRAGGRTDVVLPGRTREGFALHIVLDTSGSMWGDLPRILGVIASFCEAVNVAMIHVLQCDTTVTHDDWLDPMELARYPVGGGGGSDMSPAMVQLARDPQVEAAIVLTDGAIDFPSEPMPYDVLWGVIGYYGFSPAYGTVMRIPAEHEVD